MNGDRQVERVLRVYPDDCQPLAIEPFASPNSFSGAGLWRLRSPRGELCLRCWGVGHPDRERLEFIQAVLWHVDQEGFHLAALPLETRHSHGYVRHAGSLWELTPWLAGQPDYRQRPNPTRLQNALTALADFHRSASSFPLPDDGPDRSPGLMERLARLKSLMATGAAQIRAALRAVDWPELLEPAGRLLSLFESTAPKVLPQLEQAASLRVPLQPCIRDVWHAHVLFTGDRVSGLVDFGSMRPDNVGGDVARLLGSLALDDVEDWQRGIEAYQDGRRLSCQELTLVTAFDRSTVLMGGLQWLQWIYLEQRTFNHRAAVVARIDEFLSRLTRLSQQLV